MVNMQRYQYHQYLRYHRYHRYQCTLIADVFDPIRPAVFDTMRCMHADQCPAYSTLHRLGWAHSVEVFDRQGQLAGGLYGVRINRFFAGESMFHRQRDASKVALMALVQLMQDSAMQLLDVQWCTPHLASLGAVEVSRRRYLRALPAALSLPLPPAWA